MGRYKQELGDNDGWTRWVCPVEENYKMSCCDCGLVHDVDFRVFQDRAEFRMRRNNRSTGQKRRYREKTDG